MFYQYFQDPSDCSFMLLLHLHKDQNVVQVHYHNPFGYEGPEDVVHHSLEGGRTVGYSEEHYERFKEAVVGVEGCFPFISRLDAYVVETPSDIKFCEVLSSVELGDKLGDEGKGVSILNGYSIQCTIVLDQPEQAIFLLNKEHRGCYRGFGRSDLSSMQVFLQKGIQLSLFQRGQVIDL